MLVATSLPAQVRIDYLPSDADFPNPERGFYRYTETRAENYQPLSVSQLQDFRNPYTPFGANYSVVSSLAFRYFFLEDFTGGPISQNYLNQVSADFAAARAAGVKIIPRFAYTDAVDGSGCPSFICPPYGDAPKAVVLNHLNQLAPILAANKDVIAALQLGFIGVWGENYYTDHFGDASPEGNGQLFDANWNDRNEVLAAALAALPGDRMVQVRYPQGKQRFVYGINAPTSAAPLTAGEAYGGSDKARIGFHNDCLLASADDFGTYANYGNSSGGPGSDTAALKPYVAADSRYVVVGGETCSDGYNPQNNCRSTSGQAFGDRELRRMHYSYLNADYNQEVNNDWQSGGCMDDIKRSLGYRFALEQGDFPASALAGGALDLSLRLQNLGYAAPYNPRAVELILREVATGEIWRAELAAEPRRWASGATQQLSLAACLPPGMPVGDYEILLHLPDPEPALYGRADYSIRLANRLPGGTDVWEAGTGFNRLGHTLRIERGGNPTCSAATFFVADNLALPVVFGAVRAVGHDKVIQLFWHTETEEHLREFVVERSGDGVHFTALGSLLPHPSRQYHYADATPLPQRPYFYRLRAVDQDSSYRYSSVVSARLGVGAVGFRVVPNPTGGLFSLAWASPPPAGTQLMIHDAFGRLLHTRPATASLPRLLSGTYTIMARTGEQRWIRRVVVK